MNEEIQTKDYPNISIIRGFPQVALGYYRTQQSENPKSIALMHNAYVNYTIMLQQFATGARPINAIFSDPACLDLKSGLVLVSDKVVIESRAFRLLPLTEIAVQQWEKYLEHLAYLAARLANKPGSRPITYSIQRILSGSNSQKIPLCFYLSEDLQNTINITKGHLDTLYSTVLDMPSNISRTILATESEESGLTGTDIEILLGHNESVGLDDPFGHVAMRAPLEYLGFSRKVLESNFDGYQWKVLAGPFSRKGAIKRVPSSNKKFDSPHDEKVFGFEARSLRRHELAKKARRVVKDAFIEIFPEEIPRQPSKAALTKLRHRVVKGSREAGVSETWALRILYKRLTKELKGKSWTKQLKRRYALEPEPSPFDPNSLVRYKDAKAVRLRFADYLEKQGRKSAGVDAATRLAELTIHVALSSRVGEVSRLQQLWRGAVKARVKIGELEVLEIPLPGGSDDEYPVTHRLVLDDFSKYLLFGLFQGVDDVSLRALTADDIESALFKLGKALGLVETKKNDVWAVLADLSQSLALLEVKGVYREILSRRTPSRTLPLEAIIRLRQQSVYPMDGSATATYAVEAAGNRTQRVVLERGPFGTVVRGFKKEFRNIVEATKEEIPSAKKLSESRKALLSKKMKLYMTESNMPFSLYVLCSWCVRLCDHRTIYGHEIVFGTVVKYTRLILHVILNNPEMREMEAWNTDQYGDFYSGLIEGGFPGSDSTLPGRLMDFDAQVCSIRARVGELDWSGVLSVKPRDADSAERKIDANIVTEAEYEAVLSAIMALHSLPHTERYQIATLLILGFRFGLRWAEAFYLQVRDIQYSDDLSHLYINVRSNELRELKSIAGRRRIPLIKALSGKEKEILSVLIRHAEVWRGEDSDAQLTKDSEVAHGLLHESRASSLINGMLKAVSGNPLLHYHHCRHTFASRMMLVAFADTDCPLYCQLFSNLASDYISAENLDEVWCRGASDTRKLRAISTLLGHVSPVTTIIYSHVFDALTYLNAAEHYDVQNLHLAAYVLGKSHSTVSRQLYRTLENRPLEKFMPMKHYYKGAKVFQPYEPPFMPAIEDNGIVNSESPHFNLLQVHDLLVSFGRQRSALVSGSTWMISADELELYNIARNVEFNSGYTRYGLVLLSPTALQQSVLDELPDYFENQEEDLYLREQIVAIVGVITSIEANPDTRNTMGNMLRAWQGAYSHRDPYLIFEDIVSLTGFLEGVKLLPLKNMRWNLLLPSKDEGEFSTSGVLNAYSNLVTLTDQIVRLSPGRGKVYESARVGLRLQKNPGLSMSREGMSRVLFTLLVWLDKTQQYSA
ncbi:MAG: hypothetical protein DRR06_08545 [Gammaproteobacteria bacterium]|nr:MAG: hypothetical protein DRR06_08545 [Gammaproteobacteria bacterium]RLA50610.1 MAG: hypothetical protein DRR42_12655 [Gammaproteobacteria bacterium]